MRRLRPCLPTLLGTALASATLSLSITGAEPARPGPQLIPEAVAQAPKEQPKAPVPAAAPEQPAVPAPTQAAPATPSVSPTLISDILGGAGTAPASNPLSQGTPAAANPNVPATGASTVGGGESVSRASTDVGDLLGKSINALGVYVHHRSPIITEPFVRGYRVGQYTTIANGGYWFPARLDLDTVVSKFESSQLESVTIIKGPYSVRYGPGFAFIDVETLSSPRYQNGWETHGSTGLVYKSNGQQWSGLQSVWAGNESFGYRITYTIADGADYWDARGREMPSGYNSQSFNADVGFNIGRYARVEIKGMHLEQRDVEIPGAFYDIAFLGTDAYTGRFLYDDQATGRLAIDTWFNYTHLYGDNFNPSKRAFIPALDDYKQPGNFPTANHFFGQPTAELASWGYRAAMTFGGPDQPRLTVGSDLTFLDTQGNNFVFTYPDKNFIGNPAMPHSYLQDPGCFFDVVLPLRDNRLAITGGMRFDWARTAISNLTVPLGPPGQNTVQTQPTDVGSYFPGVALGGSDLTREYALISGYISAEWKPSQNLGVTLGFGHAQRPPTLAELYPIGMRMGVLQNGLNNIRGNPFLAPETLRQADVGFRLNFDRFRAGASGFYSWVHNYITYQNTARSGVSQVLPPASAALFPYTYQFVNTDQAVLAGGEMYLEWDASRYITLFGTAAYVQGEDQSVNHRTFVNTTLPGAPAVPGPATEALPNIPPLDTRVGIRLRDPRNGRWGAELATHIVAQQNRVATSLIQVETPTYTLVDLRTYWRPNQTVLFTAGIENLTNTLYQEWADYRTNSSIGVFQPGFSAYVGLRLTY